MNYLSSVRGNDLPYAYNFQFPIATQYFRILTHRVGNNLEMSNVLTISATDLKLWEHVFVVVVVVLFVCFLGSLLWNEFVIIITIIISNQYELKRNQNDRVFCSS